MPQVYNTKKRGIFSTGLHRNNSTNTTGKNQLQPFASLTIPSYRWYWIGAIIGPGAIFMQAVARGWLIYEMTDSAFLLGLITSCLGIPFIFIVPFSGVIADRVDKRNMILFAESIIMISSLALTVLVYLHMVQVWHLIVTTLGLGIGMALSMPSRQAIISELLDKDYLLNGIALYSMGSNSMRILGPVLAGLMAGFFGLELVFLVSSLLFVLVLISIFLIGPRGASSRIKKTNQMEDLLEGLKYLKHHPAILVLILCAYVIALLGSNYVTLLPVFVADIFKLGPSGLGFLTGAAAVGAMASAIAVAWMGNLKRKGWVLLISCLAYGLALIAFAATSFYILALVILIIVGAAQAVCLMMNQTILQTNVDQSVLGRVLSVYLISSGLQNIAGIPFGGIAQGIGAPSTIIICGITLALFAVVLMFLAPKIRELG